MAAKKKTGKSPVTKPGKRSVKKTPRVKVVEVTPAKKPTGRVAAALTPTTRVKRARKPIAIKHVAAKPEWHITLVFGNDTGVFGLANDQRIYRWNTRSALWVLHKEGLSTTQA